MGGGGIERQEGLGSPLVYGVCIGTYAHGRGRGEMKHSKNPDFFFRQRWVVFCFWNSHNSSAARRISYSSEIVTLREGSVCVCAAAVHVIEG